jgi:hypothetical protein
LVFGSFKLLVCLSRFSLFRLKEYLEKEKEFVS